MDHFIRNIWGSKFCSNNSLIKIKYVRSLLCSRVSQTQVWSPKARLYICF